MCESFIADEERTRGGSHLEIDMQAHTHTHTKEVDKAKDLEDEAEKCPSVNVCIGEYVCMRICW